MEEELVEIYRADPIHADLVRARLEGSGLEAVIWGSGQSAAYPLAVGSLGETRVLVREKDVARAREILAEEPLTPTEEPEDELLAAPSGGRTVWRWVVAAVALLLVIGLLLTDVRTY